MNKHYYFNVLFLLLILSSCRNTEIVFQNPLPIQLSDPYILSASDGKYYMYGSSGDLGFKAYSSSNLVDWKDEGMVYNSNTPDSWAVNSFRTPEVYERKGKYYLFYSANWKHNPQNEKENFRIGVAISDKPTGPFKELNNKPIFDFGYPVTDPNLLFNQENGNIYLYYSRCSYKHPVESVFSDWVGQKDWFDEVEESWIYGVELKPDLSGIRGEPVILLRPPLTSNEPQNEWENSSVMNRETNCRSLTAPSVFKKKNLYYMMYTANHFGERDYAIGYATAIHVLGPFIKSRENPILQKDMENKSGIKGAGHNMVLALPDNQLLCVYNGQVQEAENKRSVFIDRMEVQPNGKLVIYGPTTTYQK